MFDKDSILNILEGTNIKENSGDFDGAVASKGIVNIYGGSITNNTSTRGTAVSGVFASKDVNIYGGKITGNSARHGVISGKNINLYGGEITGNSGLNGPIRVGKPRESKTGSDKEYGKDLNIIKLGGKNSSQAKYPLIIKDNIMSENPLKRGANDKKVGLLVHEDYPIEVGKLIEGSSIYVTPADEKKDKYIFTKVVSEDGVSAKDVMKMFFSGISGKNIVDIDNKLAFSSISSGVYVPTDSPSEEYISPNGFGKNEIPSTLNLETLKYLRTAGLDRIGTSVLVSQKYFDTSDYVIVASAKDFPDALTASVLSKNLRCPILLTNPNNIDSRVAKEILRLKAKNIVVVGGNNSISEDVAKELSNIGNYGISNISVRRISGQDRYETSTKIAEEVFNLTNKRDAVVLASGQLFPDSLSVGALASKMDRPILLLKRDSAPKSVQSFLANNNINKFLISGGYNTISDQAINHIYDLVENRDSDNQDMNNNSGINLLKSVEVERVSGNNRYETSLKITQRMMDEIAKTDPSVISGKNGKVFIVSGENFADALVIGGIAGMNDQGIILTQKNVPAKGSELANTNDAIRNFIKNTVKYVDVVGGKNTISDNVLLQILK